MQAVKIDAKQKRISDYGAAPPKEAEAPGLAPIAVVPRAERMRKCLKVAAYCRVSTLMESQETSIESQRAHYEREIHANGEWEFAGIYLEAGVSGTKAEIRPELQRMLRDCEAGKIDLILTKSISRFARNTQDCLEMVRALTALGVDIRFEKERIDTRDMDSEFMLSILACLAEDESRSIAGNMKWGIRKRFRDGSYRQSVPPYGYEWADGRLAVIPEQAEVVKDVFAMALAGTGAPRISQTLNRRGVPAARGEKWNPAAVAHMLKNPAYTGAALYQKSYTDGSFKQRRNNGELDQYYEEGHHEAIIGREDFEKAQAMTGQRAKAVGYGDGAAKARSANRYCFSGVLICRDCGSVMHRQRDASGAVRWICRRHAAHPELCRMRPQSDADIKRAFLNCLNKLAWSQGRRDNRLLDIYEKMLGRSEAEKNADRLAEIEKALEENRREAGKLNAAAMRGHFLTEQRQKQAALTARARELMAEKNAILINGAPRGTVQELKAFVAAWKPAVRTEAFPDEGFTAFVEKCTVLSGSAVTFHFRCGLALTESLGRERLEGAE